MVTWVCVCTISRVCVDDETPSERWNSSSLFLYSTLDLFLFLTAGASHGLLNFCRLVTPFFVSPDLVKIHSWFCSSNFTSFVAVSDLKRRLCFAFYFPPRETRIQFRFGDFFKSPYICVCGGREGSWWRRNWVIIVPVSVKISGIFNTSY